MTCTASWFGPGADWRERTKSRVDCGSSLLVVRGVSAIQRCKFTGGAQPYVTWHSIARRPLQLLLSSSRPSRLQRGRKTDAVLLREIIRPMRVGPGAGSIERWVVV